MLLNCGSYSGIFCRYLYCTWTVLELYLNCTWTIHELYLGVFIQFMYSSFWGICNILKSVLLFWKCCCTYRFFENSFLCCSTSVFQKSRAFSCTLQYFFQYGTYVIIFSSNIFLKDCASRSLSPRNKKRTSSINQLMTIHSPYLLVYPSS